MGNIALHLEAGFGSCDPSLESRSDELDLVDALLVTVGESHQAADILTLDHRGFSAYRLGRNSAFSVP